jgi:cyclic beta-1,2-glucan synthetase
MASVTDTAPRPAVADPQIEDILRGEPFGIEHLENHARQLAGRLIPDPRPASSAAFSRRFEENAEILRNARELLAAGIQAGDPQTSETEWLLDNFHIVEEQLREIVDDLPPRCSSIRTVHSTKN